MNASTIRFDSIRSRKRNRHPPRAASLPRLSRVRVRSTSSPRRASPSPASSSHPPAAASTRPGPPPTPTPRITNTHTHTGLNAPRLRKTTRCLPREIKNKNTYPSHLSSVYDPSVPPSYNHTCSDIRRPTVGPDATDDRGRRGRGQIASSSRVRACVGSIDRSCVDQDLSLFTNPGVLQSFVLKVATQILIPTVQGEKKATIKIKLKGIQNEMTMKLK